VEHAGHAESLLRRRAFQLLATLQIGDPECALHGLDRREPAARQISSNSTAAGWGKESLPERRDPQSAFFVALHPYDAQICGKASRRALPMRARLPYVLSAQHP